MIELTHVSKTYGPGSRAVKDLNLTIEALERAPCLSFF